MEIRHRRVTSSVRAIALLVLSIMITAAVAAVMLIDALTAPALTAAAPHGCLRAVSPMLEPLQFVERRCR